MLTYLLRHARTAYSAAYRVNGRPDLPVALDHAGKEQCRSARATLPVEQIATCMVSGFRRTVQTAALLLAGRPVSLITDSRLNEIDYGAYEGGPFLEYGRWLRRHGPWARPAGSAESQREAILRMLGGLGDALAWPGPRLVIGHGLLLSVVIHVRDGRPLRGAFFPEAPHVSPLCLPDDELVAVTRRLVRQINAERADRTCRGHAAVSGSGCSSQPCYVRADSRAEQGRGPPCMIPAPY